MNNHANGDGRHSAKPHSHEETYTPGRKRAVYTFFSRLTKIIWWLFVLAIVVEGGLIVLKMLADKPHERLCFDAAGCYEYCATFSGAQCAVPDQKDTADPRAAWRLLLTGKRTILEILNENQGYCACVYQTGETNRIETFYQFYSTHQ